MSIDPRVLLSLVSDGDLIGEFRRRGIGLDRLNDKPCPYCGAMFTPNRGQKYCSVEHRKLAGKSRPASTERSRAWREAHRDAHNAYHRWYQKRYRDTMTDEQKARHRAQKREWWRRKTAEKRAPGTEAA